MTQDTCEEWAPLFGPLSLLLQVEEKENVTWLLFSPCSDSFPVFLYQISPRDSLFYCLILH